MTNWHKTRIDNIEYQIKCAVHRLENWEKAIAKGTEEDSFDIRFYRERGVRKCKQELTKLNSKLEKLQGVVDAKEVDKEWNN